VKNEKVLFRGQEDREYSAHNKTKNCLFRHVVEGKIERRIQVTGRWE
jgi:hypothetical protein